VVLPTYLTTDIHLVSGYGRRPLSSSTDRTLTVPRTHNRFDDRSFAVAGPRLWNSKLLNKVPGIRRVRRTLDAESTAMLVHTFVASRVDYCNTVLAGAPKSLTDKLQRVLNVAARVVSNTRKYDHRLSELLHDELH